MKGFFIRSRITDTLAGLIKLELRISSSFGFKKCTVTNLYGTERQPSPFGLLQDQRTTSPRYESFVIELCYWVQRISHLLSISKSSHIPPFPR